MVRGLVEHAALMVGSLEGGLVVRMEGVSGSFVEMIAADLELVGGLGVVMGDLDDEVADLDVEMVEDFEEGVLGKEAAGEGALDMVLSEVVDHEVEDLAVEDFGKVAAVEDDL